METKVRHELIPSKRFSVHIDGVEAGHSRLTILFNEEEGMLYGHITDVFVKPEYRRRGISSRLHDEMERLALEWQLYKITADSRYANTHVHAFYQKRGYADHGKEFRLEFTYPPG